jgi:hypothetical protein
MMDVAVEIRVSDLLEPSREERTLGGGGIANEDVDVEKWPSSRSRVESGDLRPFQDHDRPVDDLAHTGHERSHGERPKHRALLVERKPLGQRPTELTPATGREQLEPVLAQVVERSGTVDKTVDGPP